MFKYILLFLLPFYCIQGHAQNVDYNRVILPSNTSNVEFSERLVQLAWDNHPDNHAVRKEREVADYELTLIKRQWMESFRAQGNLNEFNILPAGEIQELRANFFPRYNFGVTFTLGDIFMNPIEKRQQIKRVEIADEDIKSSMLRVRREVLTAYNNFLMLEEIHRIQSIALQDAESNHLILEDAFKQGEESYDNYVNSFGNINMTKIAKLNAQTNYLNSKLALEEMIGIPLEEVE